MGSVAMPTAAAAPGRAASIAFPAIAVQIADEVSVPEPPTDPSFGVVVAPGVIPAPSGNAVTAQLTTAPAVANVPLVSPEPVVTVVNADGQTPDWLTDTGLVIWPMYATASLLVGGGCFVARRLYRSLA